jgi:hypothetical protein
LIRHSDTLQLLFARRYAGMWQERGNGKAELEAAIKFW